MRYISLFSGIEAASCAWEPLGWAPIAFSEIEPFPKAVLKHHYPNVPDLGDITKIDWSTYAGSADIVVGGSPCQSFSVAGSRTGLAGASGLMWEDFRCLLESMDDLGYGLAWRVLDAQFFGVAQRRRRVFVVGHLGDQRACEVLFEPESLRWDSVSSREKRKTLTEGTQGSAGAPGARAIDWNRTNGRCRFPADPSLVQTLSAHMGTGGDNVPPIYQIAGNIIGRQPQNGCNGRGYANPDNNGAYTLTATDRFAVWCAADAGSNSTVGLDIAPTLTAHEANSASYIATPKTLQMRSGKEGGGKGALVAENLSATLTTGVQQTLFPGDGRVRLLTPLECERLQGFEDDWTDVPYRGKEHSPDSARYKALGNSMAVPVMKWIGEGISLVDRKVQQ